MAAKKASKPRLGRGLSSLLSIDNHDNGPPAPPPVVKRDIGGEPKPAIESAAPTPALEEIPETARVLDLPLAKIGMNPRQPRKRFEDAALSELAASLKTNGLIQPVVVRKKADGYELIAGERRYRAAELAGLESLPAILREADSASQARLALVENIHRQDLNAIERAEAYQDLMDEAGLTQQALADELGEDRSSIANHLRLLNLAPPVRELVAGDRLSLGHAKVIAGVEDAMEQERLAKLVVSQGLSVRNVERLAKEGPKQASRSPTGREAHLGELEDRIRRETGLRAQVSSRKGGKGKLTLHYASLDQFDELLGKLGVRLEN